MAFHGRYISSMATLHVSKNTSLSPTLDVCIDFSLEKKTQAQIENFGWGAVIHKFKLAADCEPWQELF